jgi:hypothetical protein
MFDFLNLSFKLGVRATESRVSPGHLQAGATKLERLRRARASRHLLSQISHGPARARANVREKLRIGARPIPLANIANSETGQKQTFALQNGMSAFGH